MREVEEHLSFHPKLFPRVRITITLQIVGVAPSGYDGQDLIHLRRGETSHRLAADVTEHVRCQ